MQHKCIALISLAVFLLFVTAIAITASFAEQSSAQPSPSSSPVTTQGLDQKISTLEQKTFQLEAKQTQLIESLKSSNDQSKYLLTAFGAFIGLLVAVQGLATFAQLRREGKRDERQVHREEEIDRFQSTGVDQVSKIMDVVKRTLESRLTAEKQAREEAKKASGELDKVLGEIKFLDQFFKNFQTNIRNARSILENTASQWAQEISRHDFRRMANDLSGFARQFDTFKAENEGLEEQPHQEFSARVLYIRGIAAHYANRPEVTKQYLTQVAAFQQPETGETEIAYNRRVANAFYYLGLTESNFGNYQNAIDSFDKANERDIQGRDFLTRVVTAEACAMNGDYERALLFIREIEDGLHAIEGNERRLSNFHLRLRSRASLVLANMAIMKRGADWRDEVRQMLEPVHGADPQYYYATATLAQACTNQGNADDEQKLFREACEAIEHSGDFFTVIEARSQILLRMVAGMCCKHVPGEEKRSEEHLDRADGLLGSLPKIGPQICTVFSALSKRNESSETIRYHINLIREGSLLLEPRK